MQSLEFKGIRDPEILTKIGAKLKTDRRRGILERFEFQVTKDKIEMIDVFLLDVSIKLLASETRVVGKTRDLL